MENIPKTFKNWRCFSLSSGKDSQISIDNASIHYFLAQSLTFGSQGDGVISFIITNNNLKDSLSAGAQEKIKDRLQDLVTQKTIMRYHWKIIIDGAVRITAVFSAEQTQLFSLQIVEKSLSLLNLLGAGNYSDPQGLMDELSFSSEIYIRSNERWVTEQDYILRRLGITTGGDLIDEEANYQANIQDLF